MNQTRDPFLLKYRPEIKNAKVLKNSSPVETFQNITLRPIIKFQHSLLFLILKNYLVNIKFDTKEASLEKTTNFISKALQTNTQLNLQVVHSITGLFTTEEFEFYAKNTKEINKRILQICKERFLTNLDAL